MIRARMIMNIKPGDKLIDKWQGSCEAASKPRKVQVDGKRMVWVVDVWAIGPSGNRCEWTTDLRNILGYQTHHGASQL